MNFTILRGFLVKYVLPVILERVFKLIVEMTPELRKELGIFIKQFKEKCSATDNPYDDEVALFLWKMLGYE